MDCISGWCKSKNRLDGVTTIVTGSNTGIGKETAIDFYNRGKDVFLDTRKGITPIGARVIMACRNIEKATAAKQDIENTSKTKEGTGELIIEQLDLCSLKSVKQFANRVISKEDNLRILICNAGVMMCPEGRTEDGFETHMGSNHLAHALLALLLLPTLNKNGPSRIVFVSSYLHEMHNLDLDDLHFDRNPYDAYKAYCRSKGANVLFARALANKLKENNISQVSTYSVHPGVIRTDISRHFNETVGFGTSFMFNYVLGGFLKSPQCGAQTTVYCAVDDACAKESGLYYSDCAVKNPSKQCRDDDQAAKFWDLTVQDLKLDLSKYNPFGKQNPTQDAYIAAQ